MAIVNLVNYNLYNDKVDLILKNGSTETIYFNNDSGKACYRYKIGSISKIKHPGIYLGKTASGIHCVAHNHYMNGKPSIVSWQEFAQGRDVFPYDEFASNAALTVIEIALNGILKGERYTALTFNCQSYVNEALRNQRESRAINNWSFGVVVGLIVVAGLASR